MSKFSIITLSSAICFSLVILTACGLVIDVKKLESQCSTGNDNACVEAAAAYVAGHGVEIDYAKSRELFSKAAHNGHPIAQLQLASFYENGLAVEQDYSEAYVWYKLAALNDNEKSKSKLQEISQKLTQDEIAKANNKASGLAK